MKKEKIEEFLRSAGLSNISIPFFSEDRAYWTIPGFFRFNSNTFICRIDENDRLALWDFEIQEISLGQTKIVAPTEIMFTLKLEAVTKKELKMISETISKIKNLKRNLRKEMIDEL